MKKALLIIFGPTDGTEILRVVRELKNYKIFSPEVLFLGSYQQLADRLDYSVLEGVPIYDINDSIMTEVNGSSSSPYVVSSVGTDPQTDVKSAGKENRHLLTNDPFIKKLIEQLRRVASVIFHFFIIIPRKIYVFINRQIGRSIINQIISVRRQYQTTALRLLKRSQPDIIVLPLEAINHISSDIARAAHAMHIPCVIVPYTVPINIGEICERWCEDIYFKSYSISSSLLNRLVARYFPRWVYEYQGKKLLRLKASQILALEWNKMAPPDPWKAGGLQFADAIAVENQAMYDYYVSEGYPEEKLVITGALADDILYEGLQNKSAYRSQLYKELGLSEDQPMILSSMPADFVYREACEFDNFKELVEFWTKTLASILGYNVVIRLHPSLSYMEYKYIEQWGVKLTQKDTASLIPLCDIFVTSISATIRWAIACGIPVINYDLYRFRYPDYIEAGGVLTIVERAEYIAILDKLAYDEKFYKETTQRQRSCAPAWGNLNGSAGSKMVALFHDKIAELSFR